jgi:AmmeMemoRadiSam system protein B
MPSPKRPELRPVETLVVPDRAHGRVLVLRDTQGIAPGHAVIPPPLVPIVSRFDGRHSTRDVAREASEEMGRAVDLALVEKLADELDRGFFLFGPTFEEERDRIQRAFAECDVRPASHAGGAYHADPAKLSAYLDGDCLERDGQGAGERERETARARRGRLTGLIAPHIDPWRGAAGYGRAYRALRDSIGDEADTFVVFGTSHAPMQEPFSICPKAFATPLGDVPADDDACRELARAARFDPLADLFNHKREHSIEFQVLFLKHVLGARPFRIVPILAGLGRHQVDGSDPSDDAHVAAFVDSVRELVERRSGRVVIVAGADLAHVGPRFGDKKAYDAGRRATLEARDRASLDAAVARAHDGFWSHVLEDMHERRVCGLAPIWSLLRVIPDASRGSLVHYEQTVDEEDGSIVSHAGAAFVA